MREACGDDIALRREAESLLVIPALRPGAEVGHYRILGPLDAGGMGEVYRAHDTHLERDVAVKVLPAAFSDDPERVARLEREARLLAALNHPHIATIHGLEQAPALVIGAALADATPGSCVRALVMELVEGPTLADRLMGGALPLREALEVARQIAEALEAAHQKGIVHRDLKPANIKLTATGTVKVLDFGLAKVIAPDAGGLSDAPTVAAAATREGMIAGTPAYMSPEHARGHEMDRRTDIWAFGCVVYEMLTGRRAFAGATVTDTLAAVLEREPDWTLLPSDAPEGVRRLLRRCLNKDPRRRLHDMADARIELEDAIKEPAAAEPAGRRAAPSGHTRVLTIAGAILVGLLVLAVSMLYSRAPGRLPELRVDIMTPRGPEPSWFSLSPDGRQVAFVAERDGQPTLWVRSLDAATARALPGTEGSRLPFWSHDGLSLGFFSSGGELKRIETRGGAAQVVTTGTIGGTGAAWGPDGTILFSDQARGFLRRVNAAGGPAVAATTAPPGSSGHRFPQFLPGGREFLFFASGPDEIRGVYLGSFDSPDVTRLVASDGKGLYLSSGWLLFVRQGALFAQRFDLGRRALTGEPVTIADAIAFEPIFGSAAFSVSDGGVIAYRTAQPSTTQLSWFDRSGTALGVLGSGGQVGLSNLRLSPDGSRVAVERTVGNDTDLWLLDPTRQVRFTRGSSERGARFPIWSPDGRRIAFQAFTPSSVRISVKSLAGGDEEVLFESPEIKVPTDWSQDGRFLMYYMPDPMSGTDLWVLPLDGSRAPSMFLKNDAVELQGQFSPDGRWVAYQSNETGRFDVYVRSFPQAGEAIPISTGGGVYPRWSFDGRELYYIAPDATLMAVSLSAKDGTLKADTPIALFQTRRVGRGANVVGRSHQYDVTRDGRFLINVEGETPMPITLLMNWTR